MSHALENIRRLMAWSRARSGAAPPPDAIAIRRVGIVGAGMMGRAIAAATARHGISVVLGDLSAEILASAVADVAAELQEAEPEPGRSGDSPFPLAESFWPEPRRPLGRPGTIAAAVDLADAAGCDLVLESIVESLPAKQRLYRQLGERLAEHSILASNTSTIPIGRLAGCLADASRFCGIHFFHPVRHRPLVEVVRGPQSDARTIAAAAAYVGSIGRTPIVVQDGPGFVVNRLLFPYLGEALQLLREGVPAAAIEQAAIGFGMAVGPLRFMDEIGLDTTLQAGWVLAAAFPQRVIPSPLLVSLVKAGRCGRKTGAGFYAYPGQGTGRDQRSRLRNEPRGRPPELDDAGPLDPAAQAILAEWTEHRPVSSVSSLSLRLLLPMLLEATHVLEERRVGDFRELELAALLGLGFPAEKGGLLWWADTLGADHILSLLRTEEAAGERFRPTAMLQSFARIGGRFYPAGERETG